jgi:uncharacterized DUF497 family protein
LTKTIISEDGRFEWDEEKDEINKDKHGFYFSEILSVFDDPYLLERYDRKNSTDTEDRYIGIGLLDDIVVLFVCYTEKNNTTRIYSARKAKAPEEKEYYEYLKNFI